MHLILFFCLTTNLNVCKHEAIDLSFEDQGPITCMITAPARVAEWSTQNPRWTVAMWRCDSRPPAVRA